MPPTNNSFATATTIAAFPFDFDQTDINDGGVNFDVYYRFIAPAGSKMIGAWGLAGDMGSAYNPRCEPYLGPAGAPTVVLGIFGETNRPIQFPVVEGQEYFLKFEKSADTAGPESLRVRVEVFQEQTVEQGDIVVNDDSDGFPLAILAHDTDNLVRKFYLNMPAGEGGDILPSGISLLENFADDTMKVFDHDFVQVGVTLAQESGDARIRGCRGLNKFFVAFNDNPVIVRDVLPAGAYGAVNLTTTLTGVLGMAVSNDGAIMYSAPNSSGGAIRRWDMIGNVALSDLVAGIAGYFVVDIFVLADDTILALYDHFGTGDVRVLRYNAAGTLLNTFNIGTTIHEAGTFARGAYAIDNPLSFWVWMHPAVGVSRFLNIRISDGAILTQRDQTEYEIGAFVPDETATPPSRFGNSFSCPFFIMTMGETPVEPSGIYVIQTNRRNDNDIAIPTPTFKTALMP